MTWPTLSAQQTDALHAARAGGAARLRDDLAAVVVAGKHRGRFLNALLSQEINPDEVGAHRRACFCTPQGKILAIASVFIRKNDIVLATPRDRAQPLIDGLLKYRVAERVKLAVDPALKFLSHGADQSVQIIPDELIKVPDETIQTLDEAVSVALRIDAGWPLLGSDIDDGSIPLEAGLWDAVSWQKGCYLGQEAIAMMAYRGKLRRHLCWVETTSVGTTGSGTMSLELPSAGQPLRTPQGRRAGTVGSGYLASGTDAKGDAKGGAKGFGLAMIQRRAFGEGAIVLAQTEAGTIELRIRTTTIPDAFNADPSAPAAGPSPEMPERA